MRISDWSSDVCSSDLERPMSKDRGHCPAELAEEVQQRVTVHLARCLDELPVPPPLRDKTVYPATERGIAQGARHRFALQQRHDRLDICRAKTGSAPWRQNACT